MVATILETSLPIVRKNIATMSLGCYTRKLMIGLVHPQTRPVSLQGFLVSTAMALLPALAFNKQPYISCRTSLPVCVEERDPFFFGGGGRARVLSHDRIPYNPISTTRQDWARTILVWMPSQQRSR